MSGSSACWFSRAASVTAFAPCAEQCHPWFWVYGYRQVTGSDQASLCGEEQVEVHLERVAQKIVRGWTRVRWGGGSLHCRAGSRRWSWALVHPWPCRQAPLQRPCPHHRLGGALQIWALYNVSTPQWEFPISLPEGRLSCLSVLPGMSLCTTYDLLFITSSNMAAPATAARIIDVV